VVKRSCPTFSSTLISFSVDSTHLLASSDEDFKFAAACVGLCFAALFEAAVFRDFPLRD
jgi:hypothetical protein